jgi:threonine/homoserine/homoserine lactone efflux protein
MLYLRHMKNILKPKTIFLILGIVFLFIGISFGLYTSSLEGSRSMLGAIVFFYTFIVFIVLIIDRILARLINQRMLNIIEAALLLIGIMCYFYENFTIKN